MKMIQIILLQCPTCKYQAKEEKFITLFEYETKYTKCPKCHFIDDGVDWY